ncbi:MAG: CNNM domain-containing protein [Fibrobacterota bacterium]
MILLWVLVFVISVLFSFLFAGFETGFISWNTVKIEHRAHRGHMVGRLALMLDRHSEEVITTVLVGNNIALVLMSTSLFSVIRHMSMSFSPFIVNSFLTIVVLILCELLPKSLFRIYSFRLSYACVPLIYPFFIIFYPVSFVFRMLTRGHTSEEAVKSRELVAVAEEGERDKGLTPFVKSIVASVYSHNSRTLKTVCASLLPVATISDGHIFASTAINTEMQEDFLRRISRGMYLDMEQNSTALLRNNCLISSEYIIIKDKDRFLCYNSEDCFKKLFF